MFRSSCITIRTHTYDLDDMLASSRAGLDYYQRVYSPYQFSQFRILEFPRYRGFAQSFSNTVPYSEGIGFIGRVLKPTDIDITYFVTAHELGHQWWAHQLLGSRRRRLQHDGGKPGRIFRPASDGA